MNEMEETNPSPTNPYDFQGLGSGPLGLFPPQDPDFGNMRRGPQDPDFMLPPEYIEQMWLRYLEMWQAANPGQQIPPGLYDKFVRRLIQWFQPSGVRQTWDALGESINSLFIGLDIAYFASGMAAQHIRAWLIGALFAGAAGPGGLAAHYSSLVAWLILQGLTASDAIEMAQKIWDMLQEYLEDMSRDPNVPKIPKELLRSPPLVPLAAPDPIAPSMLPSGSPIPTGWQYPGQHPYGPQGPKTPPNNPGGNGTSNPGQI